MEICIHAQSNDLAFQTFRPPYTARQKEVMAQLRERLKDLQSK